MQKWNNKSLSLPRGGIETVGPSAAGAARRRRAGGACGRQPPLATTGPPEPLDGFYRNEGPCFRNTYILSTHCIWDENEQCAWLLAPLGQAQGTGLSALKASDHPPPPPPSPGGTFTCIYFFFL